MKLLFPFFLLSFATFGSYVLADRATSMAIMDQLKSVLAEYYQLDQEAIVAVSDVELNMSEVISSFYGKVIDRKESYLLAAIDREEEMLDYVRTHHVNDDCYEHILDLIEEDMFVTGVGFTSCATNRVESNLQQAVATVYDGFDYQQMNVTLLDVFEHENIFRNPGGIASKLGEKRQSLRDDFLGFVPEMLEKIERFDVRLEEIEAEYVQCMDVNISTLQMAFEIIKMQITQICY